MASADRRSILPDQNRSNTMEIDQAQQQLQSPIPSKSTEFISYLSYQLYCCALPDKRCLFHGILPLSGHDDVALFE